MGGEAESEEQSMRGDGAGSMVLLECPKEEQETGVKWRKIKSKGLMLL